MKIEKIDLKKKVMLALLAGGMLCANGALAANNTYVLNGGSPVEFDATSGYDPTAFNKTGNIIVFNIQEEYGDHSADPVVVPTFPLTGALDMTGDFVTLSGHDVTMNVEAGVYVVQNACAAVAQKGIVRDNKLTVNGGRFFTNNNLIGSGIIGIAAGYSMDGDVINNKAFITGVTCGVAGAGYTASDGGKAYNNVLTVTDCTISQFLVGAAATDMDTIGGNLQYNKVIVNSGTFDGMVLGGTNQHNTVTHGLPAIGNGVEIYGGTFNDKVYGADTNQESRENYVIINKTSTVDTIINAEVTGVYTTTTAIKNFVTINDGTIKANILAAFGGTSVEENELEINGGSFDKGGDNISLYGARVGNHGTYAKNNLVTLNGGSFKNVNIYGGYDGTEMIGNQVILNGGIFTGTNQIMAAEGQDGVSYNATTFKNNSITIGGTNALDLTGTTLKGYENTGLASGATLNVNRTNVKIGGIQNFGTINFNLDGVSSDANVLKMQGTYDLSNLGSAAINVSGITLADGDYITLMQDVSGSYTGTNVKVLKIGTGTDIYDLVYYGGSTAPTTAKGDYTIKQGGNKFDPGTIGNYIVQINGNTTDGGLSDTSYSGNEIIVRRGTYVPIGSNIAIAGAYNTTTADAISNNTVKIYDGTFERNIYGGKSSDGDVSDNKVDIYSGIFGSSTGAINIYGGDSLSGKVRGNEVNIEGGTFEYGAYIRGGYSNSGNAIGNTLIIKGGTFSGENNNFYGGESNTGNVTGNKLNIESGVFSGNDNKFYGGCSNGDGDVRDVEGNSVTVTIDGNFNGLIYGGYSKSGAVTGNSVTIDKGTFSEKIYGGYSKTTGNAECNSVTINGGTFSEGIYCGYSDATGKVEGNSVTITGGNFNEHVFGGYSEGSGNVTKNTVTILGGTFEGNGHYYAGGYSVSGDATDNTVNIERGTFTAGYKLYGGYSTATSSNNTLNLKIKMGGKASEVKFFQNMNFELPSNITNNGIMLETDSVTYDNTTIGVTAADGLKLNKDDVIYLVKADSKSGDVANIGTTVLGGAAELSFDSNDLILTLLQDFEQKKSAGSEDQQKAPVEGVAAATVIVNASADLASGQGMASLVANTAGGATDTFGAMSAGSSKYKTGSHVDVDGWGVIVGAGKTKDWKDGSATTYGLFFEYGKGDFDTYNGNVHGDGNSENKGVGIMARHKLKNNTYYEGNIRYGKQETEWSQSELGGYDTDSKYYGIMVGMGHIFPAGKNEIDVYGRYMFGHVGACDAMVGTSEYHFDSVKSHRVRVGGKYNFKVKDSNAKPYVGLAWEHEFKGESKASISGVGEAPAPSMKGNTGILEVGCDWNVSKKWTVGLGANAYMGKRKGWDGMARVFYNF